MRVCFQVISEIYDVIEEVANMSVQANFEASRKSCRELFIHFLAHYPMNAKRLQVAQHCCCRLDTADL